MRVLCRMGKVNSPGSGGTIPLLFGGVSRSVITLRIFIPVWLWLYSVEAALGLSSAAGRKIVSGALLCVGGLLLAGWVAQETAARLRRSGQHASGTMDSVKAFLRRVPLLFLAPGITLLVPFFFLALALVIALVGRVPEAGPWLLGLWLSTGGLILSLAAIVWLIIGLGALPIQVVACVTEFPQSMEIVTRSFSYVRRQPALLLLGWVTVVGLALLGTLVLLVALSLTLVAIEAMVEVGAGGRPFFTSVAFTTLVPWLQGAEPPPDLPVWLPHVARLVPAFFLAAIFSGSAGVYLFVREAIDGVKVTEVTSAAGS